MKTDWTKNERVKEAISCMPEPRYLNGILTYTLYKEDLDNICQIVAEEATRDRRVWISVDERLPEEGQSVWGKSDYFNDCAECTFEKGRFFWLDHGDELPVPDRQKISHWTPRIVDVPPNFEGEG